MRVLLINPPAENTIIGNNPPIIDRERGYNPPLGLLYVAAYARKYAGCDVEVLDAQVEELGYAVLEKIIRQKRPDLVGITAMSFTLIDVAMTAQLVKKINKDIPVVLGGPHVYLYPRETMDLPFVDYVILGEGEIPFAEFLRTFSNGRKFRRVPGLAFKENGEVVINEPCGPVEELDSLPFPAREMTPYGKYFSLIANRSPATTMITSRGCPYRCIFCHRPHLGKKFRAHSPKYVVDEMEECVKMGIKEFLVYDDTFTVDRQRVIDVCDEIIRRGLDIGWDIRARVDTVNAGMLRKLKEAKCQRVHYGIEAGTPEILKILRKGITVEQVREAFRLTREAGISTLAYFMIGSPAETREQIMQTIKLAKELDPDFVHITITTPFPGTPLYLEGIERGILGGDYWGEFARNPQPGFQPQAWQENLTLQELRDLLNYAYKSFYTRPGYVLKSLAKVRTFGEFGRKVKAGLEVLKLRYGNKKIS